MNILISSAGRRVELLRCFQADASELGIKLVVFATDARPEMSAACQLSEHAVAVPRCDSPEFIPKLLEICEENKISLLIPTIDTELQQLAECKNKFLKFGTRIAISEPDTIKLCRNKDLTASQLAAHGLPVPRTLALENLTGSELRYPIVLKPRGGSSSKEIIRLNSEHDFIRLSPGLKNYIAQECCCGPEYTVNLFFDEAHQLRVAVPHLRMETRSGEVSKGRTERHHGLIQLAERLGTTLPGAFGPLCFQAIVTETGPVIFEINARFGGGYPLAHRAGARFSKWLLEWASGRPTSIHSDWQDNLTMLRYDQSVFF
ncbi:MAG: ATP-grasp domain-containing protein [Verrucomicrobiota bacterium]